MKCFNFFFFFFLTVKATGVFLIFKVCVHVPKEAKAICSNLYQYERQETWSGGDSNNLPLFGLSGKAKTGRTQLVKLRLPAGSIPGPSTRGDRG